MVPSPDGRPVRSHSIVIPVRDRSGLTRRCLDLLLSLDECAEAEVVVVDDASTDDTPEVVGSYGDRVRLLRESASVGFAGACNAGAAASTGDGIVFLNNDTVPRQGWLESLLAYAERNPAAAVIGSRLLYPNGTVQHAGIVIGQDRFPRHLYAGFPADHPAVMRSCRVRAVSAACALMRRGPFEEAGGFDELYRNGLEDVDLCLRLSELGYEVHYCAESALDHLESASRGWRSDERTEGEKLYLSRWGDRVAPDDVIRYLDDGLIEVRYGETYPLHLRVSAHLATIEEAGREREVDRLLTLRSRQAYELLREATRLTVLLADEGGDLPPPAGEPVTVGSRGARAPADASWHGADSDELRARLVEAHEELRRRDEELAIWICELQARLGVAPSERLGYKLLPDRIRSLVRSSVPGTGRVTVVSKGDDELLRLDGRPARHFPSTPDGEYSGYYPPNSEDAIAHLEELREQDVEFLVIPATALWWLDHYREFGEHLSKRYHEVAREDDVGVIYSLADDPPGSADGAEPEGQALVPGIRALTAALLPEEDGVLVLTGGDDRLLEIGRTAWRFPSEAGAGESVSGLGEGRAAVRELKAFRARGVRYLVVPRTSFYLVEECEQLRRFLEQCRTVALRDRLCAIFELEAGDGDGYV